MNRVAHLPINAFVSVKSGLLIAGSVILTGTDGKSLDSELLSSDTSKSIVAMANNESLKARLEQHCRNHQRDQRFVRYPPDRWQMNDLAFTSIVVGESEDHDEDGIDRHDVWMFGNDPEKPFFVKIAEFTLLEVMELLTDVNERTSPGDVPEEF